MSSRSYDVDRMAASIESRIAGEIAASVPQVIAAVALLDQGKTVPFIARYRKQATGGLDETQLRALQERLIDLRESAQRSAAAPARTDAWQTRADGALAEALVNALMRDR